MDLREQYIKEKGYSYLNNNVLNEYAIWLEKKLTENHQALQLLQTDVIKSVCSDENLQCTDYKTACEKCLNAFYEYKKQTVL